MYIVTGVRPNGRRFRINCDSIYIATSINLWRGSVWEIKGGKRKLLKRVYN